MRNEKDSEGTSAGCSCGCSGGLKAAYEAARRAGLSRRNLLLGLGTTAVGSWAVAARSARAADKAEAKGATVAPAQELVVLPALTYAVPKRIEERSWRGWGGLITQDDVNADFQGIAPRALHRVHKRVEAVAAIDKL